MPTTIQILIAELEKERDYLEKEINQCIDDWDFKRAEAFRRPLLMVNKKLNIIRNLENPNYDRVTFLKKKLEQLKGIDDIDTFPEWRTKLLKERIPWLQAELTELENAEPIFFLDDEALLICLEKVCSRSIVSFSLDIQVENVLIEFENLAGDLKIILSRTDDQKLGYATGKMGLDELRKIGFCVEGKTAVMTVSDFDQHKILLTVQAVSRVMYDVFQFYGDKKALIKYKG